MAELLVGESRYCPMLGARVVLAVGRRDVTLQGVDGGAESVRVGGAQLDEIVAVVVGA